MEIRRIFPSGEYAKTLTKTDKGTRGAQRLHIDRHGCKPKGAYYEGPRQVHEENLPEVWEKEVEPPSSPDCNHLDYFVWGVSEL
jgi:hypothetical protein